MFKLKYLPQYFLVLLLGILIFLEAWTYYLGTPSVTFERYVHEKVPKEIKDLGLRRYNAAHSPHLFRIKTSQKDEKILIKNLINQCKMHTVSSKSLPKILKDVDSEMVEVMQASPYLYMTKDFDIKDVTSHRLCILFRDKDTLYLYLNGDL